MSPAKTAAQRMRTMRERRAAEALAEVRGIWAPVELHDAIKAAATRLQRKREKERKPPA